MNKHMEIYGVTEFETKDGKKSSWTRIGTAFTNKDGSLNLRFDYLPTSLAETTIQVREPRERDTRSESAA